MQPGRSWWTLLLFVILCAPALTQTIVTSESDDDSKLGQANLETIENQSPEAQAQADDQASSSPTANAAQKPYGWHIAIYPALAWVPIFGTSVTLPPAPPTPSQPIVIPGPSGSTDNALNGAFFGGARIEKGKWSADLLFMWAALEAHRETPFAKVNLDFVFGDAMVGREVFRNLYVEGGVRRLALDIDATVGSSSASRSPGYWDPVVGLTYRRQFGKKWRVLIHGDGGGFGAGSDVDVTATGRVEWQFVRHFGVTMGYGGMHFSDSDTRAGRTLTISPTLHGPIFGFGIFF